MNFKKTVNSEYPRIAFLSPIRQSTRHQSIAKLIVRNPAFKRFIEDCDIVLSGEADDLMYVENIAKMYHKHRTLFCRVAYAFKDEIATVVNEDFSIINYFHKNGESVVAGSERMFYERIRENSGYDFEVGTAFILLVAMATATGIDLEFSFSYDARAYNPEMLGVNVRMVGTELFEFYSL
jgi:hypothetical protein